MINKEVNSTVTRDETLVLFEFLSFEFLSRYSNKEKASIKHQSEQGALWKGTMYKEAQYAF